MKASVSCFMTTRICSFFKVVKDCSLRIFLPVQILGDFIQSVINEEISSLQDLFHVYTEEPTYIEYFSQAFCCPPVYGESDYTYFYFQLLTLFSYFNFFQFGSLRISIISFLILGSRSYITVLSDENTTDTLSIQYERILLKHITKYLPALSVLPLKTPLP